MEVQKPSNDAMKHLPLTPLRAIRGVVCLLVLVSTAFMMLVYFGILGAVIIRLFSTHYSRRVTSFFFGAWIALWPFLFEKINNTKVIFSGETVPDGERILLISNHRTEVDWMYLWDLALRKGRQGYIKYILKSSLMKLPLFGWSFHILEFISVERKWEVDELNMRRMLSSLKDPQDSLWLALFPEGTDFTEEKCIRSQKYAAENGLPVLKHVLLPKTKGFSACLEELRGSLDAVYDVTIGYKPSCPTFFDNASGVNPSEVHMHVQRIPLDNIPTSEDEITTWLMNRFHLKDQLLSDFDSQGHFPHEGSEGDLSTLRCLVNLVAVIVLTGTCAYLTIFSSIWFKIYVSLACAYLTAATIFNIRPLPLVSLVKALFKCKSS
ncbi:probable 1-acyl-sn-glycerol-3-phosphate acyltransferase 5 isoform X1 [Prunus avium]|uniref:1-acylglycerol-3-phosphate O-acyltransferase n=2 Tax=Prunus avium TaxID=42229 RepID=A0A6P5TL42_PRUAV|nr:probable 1-acyl-sn-glycerol-3-phosphate acyltransferase 5 isoform X1 [Prunus avium]XP_021827771.1 probable 1-acyl-sn-glycerol-3-phosphate acyltransferase 5 isoform X1 [Prunus avium]